MHDGSEDPIIRKHDYADEYKEPAQTTRLHRFKIRRVGYRKLLITKGWHFHGAYASKTIAGRTCIISGHGGDHPDYLVKGICLKASVAKGQTIR